MRPRSIAAFILVLAAAGCVTLPDDESNLDDESNVDDEGKADSTSAPCKGSACRKLSKPRPTGAGGLVIHDNTLYWVEVSKEEETDTSGIFGRYAIAHCQLPSCSTVTRLPLVNDEGRSLQSVAQLTSAGEQLVFRATDEVEGQVNLYVTDGHSSWTRLYGNYDQYNQSFAADANQLLVTHQRVGTNDYIAGMWLCDISDASICRQQRRESFYAAALNDDGAFAWNGMSIVGYDRTLLQTREELDMGSTSAWPTRLFGQGNDLFAVYSYVADVDGNARYNSGVRSLRQAQSVSVDGVVLAGAFGPTALYVGTKAQGDVFGVAKEGVIARVARDGSSVDVLATGQEAAGVAVSASRVYWIDIDAKVRSEFVGAVRSRKK